MGKPYNFSASIAVEQISLEVRKMAALVESTLHLTLEIVGQWQPDKMAVEKILKYENYEKEVREVLKDIGHPNYEKLPHLNRNPIYDRHPTLNYKKYCKHFYTEEWMKDFIRERYENDFKIFNYGMDI